MRPYCNEACIICDINGFTGRNNSNVVGQAPADFCTTRVHHMQWIGFIAGSVDLSLELTVSNCQRNQGLEIGLYEGIDCANFKKISDCDTDVRPNTKRIFTNIRPLVIGQYYYLIMDGSANDICDWSIKVLSGSTKVSPLETAPNIKLPSVICQNSETELNTDGLVGATIYEWLLDGKFIGNTTMLKYKFAASGSYKICLSASNVCDKSPQVCRDIEVLPFKETSENVQLCFGECHEYLGKKYCQTGLYDVVLVTSQGCDSIIKLDILVDDRITKFDKYSICEGDTLRFGKDRFYSEGMHNTILDNNDGCQIYLTFELKVIFCKMKVSQTVKNVKCPGDFTGQITLNIEKATPPLTYSGFKVENPSLVFSGNIDKLGDQIIITGLNTGNYTFTIRDTFGNQFVTNQTVTQPPLLRSDLILSDFSGYQVPCNGSTSGSVAVNAKGGTAPYTYIINEKSYVQNEISSLGSGDYLLVVVDTNGCTLEKAFTINEPLPLISDPKITNPNCIDIASGVIDMTNTRGGVPPYRYGIDGTNPTLLAKATSLNPGSYNLMVVDNNGCEIFKTVLIDSIVIPEIILQQERYLINLGDSINVSVTTNDPNNTIMWTSGLMLSCFDCFDTTLFPISNYIYGLSVTSKDSCTVARSIMVEVTKIRSFIMSNVFTPNGDGTNDDISYFAGNDVASILNFRLYDRWGSLINEYSVLPKGLKSIAGLEFFKGRKLQDGIYVYTVAVTYIDGYSQNYHGTITVIK